MAAAAVLLGLLPTTLSLVGSNTVDTGVLALRRPLPAAMLAAGAPSVALMRMFDYDDPVEMMSKIPEGLSIPEFKGPMSTAVVAGEYILAAAAVANLGHLSYLLCIQAVCGFTSDTSYHPALRAFLTLALQAWGTFTVGIRLRVRDPVVDTDGLGAPNSWLVRSRTRFSRLLATEFQSSFCDLKGGPIELEPIVKSNLFIFFNWLTSIFTVAHIFYGTLVFSSLLFISTVDAVQIIARFIASTVVCRIILVFEISGLQKRVKMQDPNEVVPTQVTSVTDMPIKRERGQDIARQTEIVLDR